MEYDSNGVVLGNGSDQNHLHICLTTTKLLTNLDSNLPGCYHVDGTYKLIRNKFPLIVFGRTDKQNQFHLIAFCITSHEKEEDFFRFFQGLKKLAEDLDIEFDPAYLMQDACGASYNAIKSLFPDCEVLMCYFHVVLNCKKEKKLIPEEYHNLVFKKCLRRLHMTTSKEHFLKYYSKFVDFCKKNCPDFIRYLHKSWLSSKLSFLL